MREFASLQSIFWDLEKYRQQEEWQRTRWQTWWLVNMQLELKNRLKITDLLELESDKPKPKPKRVLTEREKYLLYKWDEEKRLKQKN